MNSHRHLRGVCDSCPRIGRWMLVLRGVAVLVLPIAVACEARESVPVADTVRLETMGHVELEEPSSHLLAEVGPFAEAKNGDLLIGDALQPRVRRYAPNGRLIASFGAYGSGPFEFRRVSGIVERSDGRVLVVDPVLGRITVLSSSLEPDSSFVQLPRPQGSVSRFANGLLLTTAAGDRATSVTYIRDDARGGWTVPAPSPGPPMSFPYWGSIARILLAASAREFVIAYSLLYPIFVYNADGEVVDSLPRPASFREASVPEPGAFSGPEASERLARWLASFDVITDLAVLDDSLVIVTRGAIRSAATNRFETLHDRVDVYHLNSRSILAQDLPLPTGSRVLGGVGYLYLLSTEPPGPWTISRVGVTASRPPEAP